MALSFASAGLVTESATLRELECPDEFFNAYLGYFGITTILFGLEMVCSFSAALHAL